LAERAGSEITSSEITCDALLDGRLLLQQPRKSHRAGTDAVLLAAAADAAFEGAALDIGAGVGTAGLIFALSHPAARIGFVENDSALAALAQHNLEANGLAERGTVIEADLFSAASRRSAGLGQESADLVLTNPPFLDPTRNRLSPNPGRRRAHAMQDGGPSPLTRWMTASLALLKPGGDFIMIHRPDALAEIVAACAGRAGGITLLPVQPDATRPAHRLLVRAKKGSRAPLAIAPALVLQERGHFTERAEAIHRGTASLAW
jgi:tRNA1(Val) A37 N6-methylase TrmN6